LKFLSVYEGVKWERASKKIKVPKLISTYGGNH
jgi:hypothetical protein